MFSLSRNAIKQTIPSLDIIIMQIQKGHHEITKLIIFAVIIGIKRYYFTKPYVFGIKEYNKKLILYFTLLSCKIKNGRHEITSHIFIINPDSADIISPNLM